MTMESSEKRINTLEREVERLKAVNECMRLMGRYAYLQATGRQKEIGEMFAKNTPGVRIQFAGWGGWFGPEGIDKIYNNYDEMRNRMTEDAHIGLMFIHPNTTPLIEVAGDGKTAKGVWMELGAATTKDSKTGQLQAMWQLHSYGVDFVKEDGKWKFWHFHIYRIISADYYKSWVDSGGSLDLKAPVPTFTPELAPDGPPIDHCPYSTKTLFKFKPDPPEPYETFDEATAY